MQSRPPCAAACAVSLLSCQATSALPLLLTSSAASTGRLPGSILPPSWGLDPAKLCAGLAWAVPCLSLKASCLGPSSICDALGAAPSSSASVRAEDVP